MLIWSFSFADSSAGGPPAPQSVFDRRTLAFLSTSMMGPQGQRFGIQMTGTRITGTMPSPRGPQALDVTLATPGFFGGLQDLVLESLPMRAGVVYRIPIWRPGSEAIETRLYEPVRQEDVEVMGTRHRGAWVVEEKSADGRIHHGTMWIVNGPPFLVRWHLALPDGGQLHLDQAAIRP